jgi:hypothetical protein
MQCVGLMCGTLPPEASIVYLVPIVEHMIRLMAAGFDDDDTDSYRCLTQAFARMAESLGDAFAPYFPAVLPPIIEQATREVC